MHLQLPKTVEWLPGILMAVQRLVCLCSQHILQEIQRCDGVGWGVTRVPECAFNLSKLFLYRCLPDWVTNSLLETAASLHAFGRHFLQAGAGEMAIISEIRKASCDLKYACISPSVLSLKYCFYTFDNIPFLIKL